MASYLNVTFNHFSALQNWITETGAAATLDMRDFTMEVKHRGRYYRMYPMFQGVLDGRPMHMSALSAHVRGFGGWRPYQTLTHPHSSDKALFKQYLAKVGLATPRRWDVPGSLPELDYVLKARQGSFGLSLWGPFRAGTRASLPETAPPGEASLFAEQFVTGRMLKVWYWGARPFFAHMQEYPVIAGDGRMAARELLQRRLDGSANFATEGLYAVAVQSLAFQGVTLDDVLAAGAERWIDYRYSQTYPTGRGVSAASDNDLEALQQRSGSQLVDMGKALAGLLRETIPAPIVVTVDGVLDEAGKIWWLEMNTNSLLPPEGYRTMFDDLFA